jgi:uncharacterized membrane protein
VVILLAVNIFILCSIAGGTAVWLFNQQREVPVRQLPLAAEFLPDKARQALQKALGETYRAQRQMSAEAKQARIDAAALIGKPTLDIEALKAALAKARADDFTLRGQVEESAIAFAATLPVEQRQLLAQGLMQRLAPKPPAK